jgi:hypothetical protein
VVYDTTERIIIPAFPEEILPDAKENFAVSQDVVGSPDEVSHQESADMEF